MNNQIDNTNIQSWGDEIGIIFKITNFIHRYRLFSPFLYFPTSILNGIGSILAPIVLKSRKFKRKVMDSIDSLFGSRLTSKKKQKLYEANRRYLIQMYLDALFHSPNIYSHTLHKFIKFKNIHYLDDVLAQGKGAIIATIHSSMFFHSMAGLVYHPNKYSILTVVQPKNMMMYRSIISRPELKHFKVIPSLNYKEVGKVMKKQLAKNGIVFLMFDYSKPNHLRVPAHLDKAPFLITTPQSPIRLQELYGTPIIPTLTFPDGEVGKSIIQFHSPIFPSDFNANSKDINSKIIHGKLSIQLNTFFFDYLYRYAGFWEELRKLQNRRTILVSFPKKLNLEKFLEEIENISYDILKNSYEPERNDIILRSILENSFLKIKEQLLRNVRRKIINPFHLEIIGESGLDEILILLQIAIENLEKIADDRSIMLLRELKNKLTKNLE